MNKHAILVIFLIRGIFTRNLTFRKLLIFSDLQKSYKNSLKKNEKKDTTYQKNAYLCSVLINK